MATYLDRASGRIRDSFLMKITAPLFVGLPYNNSSSFISQSTEHSKKDFARRVDTISDTLLPMNIMRAGKCLSAIWKLRSGGATCTKKNVLQYMPSCDLSVFLVSSSYAVFNYFLGFLVLKVCLINICIILVCLQTNNVLFRSSKWPRDTLVHCKQDMNSSGPNNVFLYTVVFA